MVNWAYGPVQKSTALADIIKSDEVAIHGSVHDSIFPSGHPCVRLWRSDGRNPPFGSPAHAGGGVGNVFDFRQSHPAGDFRIAG